MTAFCARSGRLPLTSGKLSEGERMFFRSLYHSTGLNRFHSTDLTDMQDAILGEDQDGPDGGTPHVAVSPLRGARGPRTARAKVHRIPIR